MRTSDDHRLSYRQTLGVVLAVTALSLALTALLLRLEASEDDSALVMTAVVHSLVEWTSVILGVGVALLAMLYWWVYGRPLLPALLGAVFGLAGLLDGLQAVYANGLLGAGHGGVELATRAVGRLYLASGYVVLALWGRRDDGAGHLRPLWLVDGTWLVAAVTLSLVGSGALSPAPWLALRWVPAAVFVLAVVLGGSRHGRSGRAPTAMAAALLASVVPQLLSEWVMLTGPAVGEAPLASHGLKLLAMGLVMGGLAYRLGRKQRTLLAAAADLERTHRELDRQNRDLSRTQLLIAHQKEQLDMALAAGGTGTFVWHVEEDYLVLDEHLRETLGIGEKGALTRGDFVARMAPADVESFGAAVERGLRGLGGIESSFRMVGAGGELTFSCNGLVHRAPTGEPIRVTGVLTDITRQAQADEARREAEARIRGFLDALPLGVFVEDAEGETYYANDRARELLSRRASEVPGAMVDDENDEEEEFTLIGSLASVGAGVDVVGRQNLERLPLVRAYGGESTVEEVELSSPGGDRIVRMWGEPIFGADGQVAFAMAVLQDVTEMKTLEAERLQGQKLEAIGQLAAGIAHEINTPTQYVSDNTHFMQTAFSRLLPFLDAAEAVVAADKAGELGPEQLGTLKKTARKAKLDFVRREVPKAIEQSLEGLDRVATIVRAMKEFSHPGGGGMCPTDLNRAVQTTVTVARNEWKYVADVELDLAEDLPNVPVLPDELNQVILNIVVNAAHAIGEKLGEGSAEKGKIRLATRLAGDHAEILISDNGTGVPEAIRDRVFDPFFTTKPVGKGTGQGLAIARKVMIDGHHGDLLLDSVEGEGATFTLVLPLEQPDTAAGTEEAAQ